MAGEGGALIVWDEAAARAARIFREKGTNREDFAAGRVAASIIRLPIYPGLSDQDAQRVVTCVRGALGE